MEYQNTDLSIQNFNNTDPFNIQTFNTKYTSIQDYINGTRTKVNDLESNKVDKETGKGLFENNYIDILKGIFKVCPSFSYTPDRRFTFDENFVANHYNCSYLFYMENVFEIYSNTTFNTYNSTVSASNCYFDDFNPFIEDTHIIYPFLDGFYYIRTDDTHFYTVEYFFNSLQKQINRKVDKDGSKVLSDYNFSSSYKTTIDNLPATIGRYGKCTTTASTQTKAITFTNGVLVSVQEGSKIYVQFSNANTSTSKLQITVNSVTKEVRLLDGTDITAYEAQGLWSAGEIVEFIYDGTYWRIRQKDINPIGTIIALGGSSTPRGYFKCEGTQKSKTDYPKLFSVISSTFNSYSKPTSNTSFNSSTHFILPDLRETSLVGSGARGSQVSTHLLNSSSGISRGRFLDDALQGHIHSYIAPSMSYSGDGFTGGSYGSTYSATTGNPASDGLYGTPRRDYTTHGKILAVDFYIKYI